MAASAEFLKYGGTEWTWATTQNDRLKNLLRTGYRSDFTLILRKEETTVRTHKIFLQCGSRVLDSKINGSCNQLVIENVDTRVFKMMLSYFYSGDVTVKISDAIPLLKIATDYEGKELRDKCANILKENISEENVLELFECAMACAHGELIQSSLNFICQNGSKILTNPKFADLRLECLVEIIQQDKLCVDNEIEVFEAVYRWGIAECKRNKWDELNGDVMRMCLKKPLQHVRFPLMDATEFALNVTPKKILEMEDSMELLNCFLVAPEKRHLLPTGKFVSTARTKNELTLTRRTINNGPIVTEWCGFCSETIIFRTTCKMSLQSIVIRGSEMMWRHYKFPTYISVYRCPTLTVTLLLWIMN